MIWGRERMGVGSCIPPLSRLLVATATREQEHLFNKIFAGKGRGGLCF